MSLALLLMTVNKCHTHHEFMEFTQTQLVLNFCTLASYSIILAYNYSYMYTCRLQNYM